MLLRWQSGKSRYWNEEERRLFLHDDWPGSNAMLPVVGTLSATHKLVAHGFFIFVVDLLKAVESKYHYSLNHNLTILYITNIVKKYIEYFY